MADSGMTCCKAKGFLRGVPPFENVRSCCVSFFAQSEAFSASDRTVNKSSLVFAQEVVIEIFARIVVSRLLKSCAMPPARRANESNLLATRRSSSNLIRSVISRRTNTAPKRLPSDRRKGDTLYTTGRSPWTGSNRG